MRPPTITEVTDGVASDLSTLLSMFTLFCCFATACLKMFYVAHCSVVVVVTAITFCTVIIHILLCVLSFVFFLSFTLTFKPCYPDIKCPSCCAGLSAAVLPLTPSHLRLLFCVLLHSFCPSPFSPPTLTLVTMPSPGSHTVKLQHPPSATAAQISATPPLGMR